MNSIDDSIDLYDRFVAPDNTGRITVNPRQPTTDNTETTDTAEQLPTTNITIDRTLLGAQPRLPEIQIPTFSGNHAEYDQFISTFNQLIHNNEQLNQLDKFAYLKSCLRDRALAIINSLSFTSENYQEAIRLIKSRYGNSELIVKSLMHKLHGIPEAKHTSQIGTVYDHLQGIISDLHKRNIHLDPFSRDLIVKKFPHLIQQKLYKSELSTERWNTDTLMAAIKDIVLQTEHLAVVNRGDTERTTEVLYTRDTTPRQSRQRTPMDKRCIYCKRIGHYGSACKSVADIEKRRDILRTENRCFVCLASGYHKCSKKPCYKCNKNHHPSLCRETPARTDRRSNDNSQNETAESKDRNISGAKINRYKDRSASPYKQRSQTPHNTKFTSQGRQNSFTYLSDAKDTDESEFGETDTEEVGPYMSSASDRETDDNESDIENTAVNTATSPLVYQNHIRTYPRRSHLITGKLTIWCDGGVKEVHGVVDTGSQHTYISQELRQKLNMRVIDRKTLKIATFSNPYAKTVTVEVVNMKLQAIHGGPEFTVPALAIENFLHPYEIIQLTSEDKQYLERKDITVEELLTDKKVVMPEILIGNDLIWTLYNSNNKIHTLPSGFVIFPTLVGNFIGGCGVAKTQVQHTYFNRVYTVNTEPEEDQTLDKKLKTFWDLDTIGIREDTEDTENDIIRKQLKESIEIRKDGIYVKFPFIEGKAEKLPSNRKQAEVRLRKLVQSLQDRKTIEKYNMDIQNQLDTGIIETVPETEIEKQAFYLPHRGVEKLSSSTTQLRIVFDGSSHSKGNPSLNQVMHKGPVLLKNMVALLIRSRSSKYIMTSDVQKAFSQIRLKEEDKDKFRFLWIKDICKPATRNNTVEFRFQRVPFGAKSSPFILACVIDHIMENTGSAIAEEIRNNIYVDNIIFRGDSTSELAEKYRVSKQMFRDKLYMNLRQYASNNKDVTSQIPEKDRDTSTTVNLLGLRWILDSDRIAVRIPGTEIGKLSKRVCVRMASSIFDPLGIIGPLVLPLKVFIQKLWIKETEWDTPLSIELETEFRNIYMDLLNKQITVNRNVFHHKNHRLVVFTDASTIAYASAAYIVDNTSNKGSLLFAKNRIAPRDKTRAGTQTIPRLETLAILAGARTAKFIVTELQDIVTISSTSIFSDSQVALSWVANENTGRMPIAVSNACKKIKEIHQEIKFSLHYVDTKQNPADINSRGTDFSNFMKSDLWFSGPNEIFSRNIADMRDYNIPSRIANTSTFSAQQVAEAIIDFTRFSNYNRLLRTTSFVLKFLHWRIYQKVSSQNKNKLKERFPEIAKKFISPRAENIKDAERIIIQQSQKGIQTAEIQKFDLHKDTEGIYRLRGRLAKTEWSFDKKHPIYINEKSELLPLLIRHTHNKVGHSGIAHTVSELRNKFEFPKIKGIVKRVLRKCVICARYQKKVVGRIRSPDLPASRVRKSTVFSRCGVDALGPMQVSECNNIEKIYVVLFTCMITRSVHLEVAKDMSAPTFLHIFRRFISRRTVPEIVYSDNGGNFVAVREFLHNESINNLLNEHRITWVRNTPISAWRGGFYERMVQIVKKCYYKMSGKKIHSREEFITIMTEIEAIINSRPLTFVHSAHEDSTVLRPCDFICPKVALQLSSGEDVQDYNRPPSVSQAELLDLWHKGNEAINHYWDLWSREYLTELRKSHLASGKEQVTEPQIGEIVLIAEDNKHRKIWPLAIVVNKKISTDTHCRTVTLRLPDRRVIDRPTERILRLEVVAQEKEQPKKTEETSVRKSERLQLKKKVPYKELSEGSLHESNDIYSNKNQEDIPKKDKKPQKNRVTFSNIIRVICLLGVFGRSNAVDVVCSPDGVQINNNTNNRVTVCIRSTCKTSQEREDHLLFRKRLLRHDYRVKIVIHQLDNLNTTTETRITQCTGTCNNYCFYCIDYHLDPNCSSMMSMVITAVILLLTLSGFVYVLKKFCTISKEIRRRQTMDLSLIPLVLLLISEQVTSCSNVDMIPVKDIYCTNEGERCISEIAHHIRFSSTTPQYCIQIRNEKDQISANISVTLENIQYECMKQIMYYTRPVKTRTTVIERCAGAGSCNFRRNCMGTAIASIKEFSGLQEERRPGVTKCLAGRGTDCMVVPSCNFIRNYAEPEHQSKTNDTVLFIFPSYSPCEIFTRIRSFL